MSKKLIRVGNSLALVIDKPILELLKIEADTPLDLSTEDGQSFKVTKAPKTERNIQEAFDRINKKYGNTLKNLAK